MTKTTPTVTILMPFYNADETLTECLESIQKQTETNFELLAIDDGSSDYSLGVFQEIQSQDSRFRLLTPGKVGFVNALNLGLANLNTPLVARMDADDIMAPTRLEKQLQFMHNHPDIALVASMVNLFPEEEIHDGLREYIHWQNGCITPEDIANEIYWESRHST